MENKLPKYALEDIKTFIEDYKASLPIKPHNWMLNIPILGREIWQKASFESMKIKTIEKWYNEALNASPEEQLKFINEMTPVLDEFYSTKEQKSRRR